MAPLIPPGWNPSGPGQRGPISPSWADEQVGLGRVGRLFPTPPGLGRQKQVIKVYLTEDTRFSLFEPPGSFPKIFF